METKNMKMHAGEQVFSRKKVDLIKCLKQVIYEITYKRTYFWVTI